MTNQPWRVLGEHNGRVTVRCERGHVITVAPKTLSNTVREHGKPSCRLCASNDQRLPHPELPIETPTVNAVRYIQRHDRQLAVQFECNDCAHVFVRRARDVVRILRSGAMVACPKLNKHGTPRGRWCEKCAGLSHRVIGPKCRKCGLLYKDDDGGKQDYGLRRNGEMLGGTRL